MLLGAMPATKNCFVKLRYKVAFSHIITDISPKVEKSNEIHLTTEKWYICHMVQDAVAGIKFYLQLNPLLPCSRMLFLLLLMRSGW